MATIGKLALILEAQHAKLKESCKESVSAIHEVGEAAESIKGILETAFAVVGVEMGVSALKEMVTHTVETTAATYRLSGALGITTASLQALQTAGLLGAGVKAEEFNSVLEKMAKALGTAEGGTGPAAEALQKLGLSGSELKGQHLDQVIETIAEKMADITDPTQRARIETELFGKEGQKLDGMFREGAEGIKAAREENDKLGLSLSEVDAAKVVGAEDAMNKVGLAVQGIENRFTVALAPVLTAMAEKLVSLVPSAQTMQSGIMSALKFVSEGVGYVIDAWNVLKLAGQGVSWALVGGTELVLMGINKLAEGIIWVANKLGAGWHLPEFMKDAETQADEWRKQIQSDMSDTVKKLETPESQKWGKYFDDIQTDADKLADNMAKKKPMAAITADFEENSKKIKEIIDNLQQQVDTFGMTEADKKLKELQNLHADSGDVDRAAALAKQLDSLNKQKKVMDDIKKLQVEAAQAGMTEAQKRVDNLKRDGATDDQVKQAGELQKRIDAMNDWKKEQQEANKLIEESMSPIDKYQKKLADIQKLYHDGLLTEAQADDALAKAARDLDKTDKNQKVGAEVRRFDFRLPNDPAKQDIQKQQLQLLKQNTDSQKKIEFYQEQQYNWGLQDQADPDQTADIYV